MMIVIYDGHIFVVQLNIFILFLADFKINWETNIFFSQNLKNLEQMDTVVDMWKHSETHTIKHIWLVIYSFA